MCEKKYISCNRWCWFHWNQFNQKSFKKTRYKIISLDNYSAGFKKNQIKNKRVKYINGNIKDIKKYYPDQNKISKPSFILENFQGLLKVLLRIVKCMILISKVLMR